MGRNSKFRPFGGRAAFLTLTLAMSFLAVDGGPPPGSAQTQPACLTSGADIVLSGTFTEDYYTRSLPSGTVIDAREATFLHCSQPDPSAPCDSNVYPVNLGPTEGTGICWAGGAILGQNRLDATWDEMHSPNNAGLIFENGQSTIDGVRIHNVGDGIRPRGGSGGFVIRNAWLSYVRDDCVENDHLNAGLVDDSLFDGCFVGFSARHSNTSIDGSENLWTIQNSLVRLEPMPGPPEGGELGHKGFFKWISWGNPDSRSPKLALYNNVFMAEQQGQFSDEKMGVPPGKLQDCANNIMVWLGPGDYPTALPACFTVTKDRSVWDEAVADWIRRHSDPCTTDTDCDDGNPCTESTCNTATGVCTNPPLPDGNPCTDGNLCCGGFCGAPACGTDRPCDDANPCTYDECLEADTCGASCAFSMVDDGIPCIDGLCCVGVCAPAACVGDLDCDDGDACTADACLAPATCFSSCESSFMPCGLADGCCGPLCGSDDDPDCPATICGNGICEGGGEDCFSCPGDCPCKGKNCARGCCGDGFCDRESQRKCPVDCAP